METIRNYLEHMFAATPDTPEVKKLRDELLSMMEDKYHALKAEGKSEHEAIGIVISEFGNIDELLEEINVAYQQAPEEEYHDYDFPVVSMEEADAFIAAKNTEMLMVAIGTMLCIISPGFLIGFSDLGFISDNLGVGVLLLFVAFAVGLFIASGNKTAQFKYLKKPFYLSTPAYQWVEQEQQFQKQKANTLLIVGVVAIIISPALVIMFGGVRFIGNLSISALLLLVAFGVGCFIYPSGGVEACKILLKEGGRLKKMKKMQKN